MPLEHVSSGILGKVVLRNISPIGLIGKTTEVLHVKTPPALRRERETATCTQRSDRLLLHRIQKRPPAVSATEGNAITSILLPARWRGHWVMLRREKS